MTDCRQLLDSYLLDLYNLRDSAQKASIMISELEIILGTRVQGQYIIHQATISFRLRDNLAKQIIKSHWRMGKIKQEVKAVHWALYLLLLVVVG